MATDNYGSTRVYVRYTEESYACCLEPMKRSATHAGEQSGSEETAFTVTVDCNVDDGRHLRRPRTNHENARRRQRRTIHKVRCAYFIVLVSHGADAKQ